MSNTYKRFMTIQQIEQLDLSKLNKEQLRSLKLDLDTSFYHTRLSEFLTDGRQAKVVIGEQHTRVLMFCMNKD